jgi:ring-1,2-phenylacetyl-CoA epoxidase subunit PaaC
MSRTQSEETLLLLADTCLQWGHRLSEWCGHGPALEEDIALTNDALDVIGQARALLQRVAAQRSPATTEDALAYLRDADDFHNLALAAMPNIDYAHTVLRSLMLAAWFVPVWESLARAADRPLADIAADAVKESRGHLRHASDWVIRFGDGTSESRRRIEEAIAALWPFAAELLAADIEGVDTALRNAAWLGAMQETFAHATLPMPPLPASGATPNSREHRRVLLAEMQSLARQHPGANW